MKLASLNNNTQDGELWVVSRDLYRCAPATDIAPTLQSALDNWHYCFSKLQQRYEDINSELIYGDSFLQQDCVAPLPRGKDLKRSLETIDRQGLFQAIQSGTNILDNAGLDMNQKFTSPHDPIQLNAPSAAVDFEPEIAVITGDVPLGVASDRAGDFIRLLMLSNDVLLHLSAPNSQQSVCSVSCSRQPSVFSPVAVTVDELAHFWDDYRIHLPLFSFVNGEVFDHPSMGDEMSSNFACLIADAAKNASLRAGTIIGSRENLRADLTQATLALDEGNDFATRGLRSELLSFGDELRIEMFDPEGSSIFGAIYQVVKHAKV